ncbi:uncharacterized protein K460DRAFT_418354 [Cucurbitaria berberidis CBS 394.84]|uniref:REJ domain-containing protein n=1 Tax=Cucurbitaria berberidis CBS 394.84 TaxID=1168544 RepID=A0A9P4L604_9PLEO|nr:uncharacterized protein K460DRAFT_418354 [Cucurbitaria berberidis CBS 394.84]KAF1843260.1 hypothetical protein K460DRAFT_418354 [Cucurbitaria berberidis CBS 394.84]
MALSSTFRILPSGLLSTISATTAIPFTTAVNTSGSSETSNAAIATTSIMLHKHGRSFVWPTNPSRLPNPIEGVEPTRTQVLLPLPASFTERIPPSTASISWLSLPTTAQSVPARVATITSGVPAQNPDNVTDRTSGTNPTRRPMDDDKSPDVAKVIFSFFVVLTVVLLGLLVRREWLFTTGRRKPVVSRRPFAALRGARIARGE